MAYQDRKKRSPLPKFVPVLPDRPVSPRNSRGIGEPFQDDYPEEGAEHGYSGSNLIIPRIIHSRLTNQTVRGPYGRVESYRTVRDSNGNEEETISRSIGDRTYSVKTWRDKHGIQKQKEDFINMDQNAVDEFEKMWNEQHWPMVRIPILPIAIADKAPSFTPRIPVGIHRPLSPISCRGQEPPKIIKYHEQDDPPPIRLKPLHPSPRLRSPFRKVSPQSGGTQGALKRVESRRTVRNPDGSEEIVLTRSLGNQTHIFTTWIDRNGVRRQLEEFENLDKNSLRDFDRRWNESR